MRSLALVLLLSGVARASPAPSIDLYTMGPGEELFSAFGHAAICVESRCYNYGTADFRTPLPLTWAFVRGRALFWVSVLDREWMLRYYRSVDRTVWRQHLTLPDADAERLAAALVASTDERVKYYRYHHFDDNCTTRIRDLLDGALGGRLKHDPVDRALSFRQWARLGFAGNWPLLAVTELFLGHSSDRRTDSWSAMFLPSELREVVAARLQSPPEVVYARRAPLPQGSTILGHVTFAVGGALLALLVLGGAWIGRRAWRAALAIVAIKLGLLALMLDALAILSTFPELTRNEALLVFWPTDFALPFLAPRTLARYATVRLVGLAVVLLLHAVVFTQPLSPLLLVALPLTAVGFTARRMA